MFNGHRKVGEVGMISIHILSLIIGMFVGFLGGGAISIFVDKSMFFDERYWAGWGKGYEACHKVEKDKSKEGEVG